MSVGHVGCLQSLQERTNMNWSEHASEDKLIGFMNNSNNTVKVLAADKMGFNEENFRSEGVWIYKISGDEDNGIGFLLSNIISINIPYGRGDIVQYRTIRDNEKPYITMGVNGKNN